MVTAQFETPGATIRFHDEYMETATDGRIARLSQIVSEAYQRRQLSDHAAAAFHGEAEGRQV